MTYRYIRVRTAAQRSSNINTHRNIKDTFATIVNKCFICWASTCVYFIVSLPNITKEHIRRCLVNSSHWQQTTETRELVRRYVVVVYTCVCAVINHARWNIGGHVCTQWSDTRIRSVIQLHEAKQHKHYNRHYCSCRQELLRLLNLDTCVPS